MPLPLKPHNSDKRLRILKQLQDNGKPISPNPLAGKTIIMASPTLTMTCNFCGQLFKTMQVTLEAASLEVGEDINRHMINNHKEEFNKIMADLSMVVTAIGVLTTNVICAGLTEMEDEKHTSIERRFVENTNKLIEVVVEYLGLEEEEGEEEEGEGEGEVRLSKQEHLARLAEQGLSPQGVIHFATSPDLLPSDNQSDNESDNESKT